MKKYIIALLTLIIIAFLLLGFFYLKNLIFNRSDSFEFTWTNLFGISLGLCAIEFGVRPTEYGKKNDLKVLAFLTIVTIITIIVDNLLCEKIETIKIILMCVCLPLLAVAAYFSMVFYAKWSNKRSARKKQKAE